VLIEIQIIIKALYRNWNIDNEKQDTIGNRQKVVAALPRIAGVAEVLTIENSVLHQQQSGIYLLMQPAMPDALLPVVIAIEELKAESSKPKAKGRKP
jgi:hypothetical protein